MKTKAALASLIMLFLLSTSCGASSSVQNDSTEQSLAAEYERGYSAGYDKGYAAGLKDGKKQIAASVKAINPTPLPERDPPLATDAASIPSSRFTSGTEPESKTDISLPAVDYVLNTNSRKFHYPQCSAVNQMKESNKQFFSGTRDEVIAMGYDSCGICKP